MITAIEKGVFLKLFNRNGFVLDFNNESFDRFTFESVGVEIKAKYGISKGKSLQKFLQEYNNDKVVKLLSDLLQYYELHYNDEINGVIVLPHPSKDIGLGTFYPKCKEIINRITIVPSDKISDLDFMSTVYDSIDFLELNLEPGLVDVLNQRIDEVLLSLDRETPLSVIFLCGSILEGLLFGMATLYPKQFNQAKSSSKDKLGKVRPIYDWNLSALIDTASEIGIITNDVKRFSQELREYRNYIHPYQQYGSGFAPSMQTAKICLQVLNASFAQAKCFQAK